MTFCAAHSEIYLFQPFGVLTARKKQFALTVSHVVKREKKPIHVNRPCKSCKHLFKAESARGQKCQSRSQITKHITVGGEVENIDCDEFF